MGLFGSDSASSSTTAQQPTANSDGNSRSVVTNLGPISAGKGSDIAVNVESLDAVFASRALDAVGDNNALAYDFAGQQAALAAENTGRAFDFLESARQDLSASREFAASRDADLAAKSFALADEKTASTDDRILSLGRVALYVGAGLLALLFLFFNRTASRHA